MSDTNLTKTLKELEEITAWFTSQEDIDVEEGLRKIAAGAALLKKSRARLADIENTFAEIKNDLAA